MNIKTYTILLFFLFSQAALAQKQDGTTVLDEVVIASKEGQDVRRIPVSISTASADVSTDREKTGGLRSLSVTIPNLFIPDYGSKYTSAIYIRGVGARMGNSAVGMYVDNVPFLDKTSFDFDFFDVKRIEVLRGPQGTLYGRNSMGGQINVYTLSPWDFQGTKVRLSSGNYGRTGVQLSHYARLSERFAFSLGGNYSATGAYLENQNPDYSPKYRNVAACIFPSAYRDRGVEEQQTASLRANIGWRPSQRLSLNYTGSYEYADQSGYAYGKYSAESGLADTINYNDPAYYRRNVMNNSLRIEYQGRNFKIASATGLQLLKDSLLLDQDFSSKSMFTLFQSQDLRTVFEEITVRSTGRGNFRWIGGVSAFLQNLNTGSLVTFKEDGVAFIEDNINSSGIPFHLNLDDSSIPVNGKYLAVNRGFAAFLQPSIDDFLTKGLSVSAGLRLDYECASLEHFTNSVFNYSMQMGQNPVQGTKNDTIAGYESMSFTQLLPKFSVRYRTGNHTAYISVSKGYKAGGYNLQMFSDLIETKMRTMRPPVFDIQKSTSFSPEYSWNCELGVRTSLWHDRINASMTLFLMDINNQQIAEFAPNGQGRMIKNAGKSQSKGIEIEAVIRPSKHFRTVVSYGYNENIFTEYREQINADSIANYSGKHVPFVPAHTASVIAEYSLDFKNAFIDKLSICGKYSGAGRIFWSEDNDIYQKFYSLFGGRISLVKAGFSLDFWAENISNTKFTTFYFKTFGNAFAQSGKPFRFGINLNVLINN